MSVVNVLLKLLKADGSAAINPATSDAQTDGSQKTQVVGAVPLPAGAATAAKQLQDNHNVTVSNMIPAVETGLAKDGTDGAAPPAITGTGIRGWLRAIYEKLTDSISVTGTFWQATQPVSAASLPLPAGAATEATLANRNNDIATLLNLLPNATNKKTLRLAGQGANGQMSYHLRNAASALPDAATWEALRFRTIGPSSALVATYTRSGTTVTVTTVTAHNLETDDLAYHTSPTDAAIEKYRRVTVTDSTHYTFQTAATGANGSITLQPSGPEVKYRTGVTPTSNLETGW